MASDSTVERAFELARSGSCRDVNDIRRQLKAEGYYAIAEHLDSASLRKQLADLLKASMD